MHKTIYILWQDKIYFDKKQTMNLALAIMSPILVQRKLEVQLRVPQVGTGHWEQPQEPTAKTCFRRSKLPSYSEVAQCQGNALYKLYLSLSIYISVESLQILLLYSCNSKFSRQIKPSRAPPLGIKAFCSSFCCFSLRTSMIRSEVLRTDREKQGGLKWGVNLGYRVFMSI
jgi:hypothetical protein